MFPAKGGGGCYASTSDLLLVVLFLIRLAEVVSVLVLRFKLF